MAVEADHCMHSSDRMKLTGHTRDGASQLDAAFATFGEDRCFHYCMGKGQFE